MMFLADLQVLIMHNRYIALPFLNNGFAVLFAGLLSIH